jgi:hypothetical protein
MPDVRRDDARVPALRWVAVSGYARGEDNGRAKLSELAVAEIRALACRPRGSRPSHEVIAARFGVSQVQVSRIARGVRWRHLDGHNPCPFVA